ncbi:MULTISPECIES: DUF1697 domain-containing protein [unclassified Pseudoclavibacter]|uniref:DUF1697 domain-containing protein n=1 Tax=unclassified Pseudoclavibacter TaxID=2615177 RepID=UPI000CE8134B|nr:MULTISPECIES: DUF1697 domain-containing protein [unclassified Pseudoclavibacter]PPF34041.1 DUF1697 domain-containing protein [Pseudoclavibacter sp. AY1H1]PPG03980.1 DUF1697 domain-containing protein [Pseudoclavibacter sp. RFBI5]
MPTSTPASSSEVRGSIRRIALLQSINLGQHRKLPMAELRHALEAAGHTSIATVLQTGNVLLDAPAAVTNTELETRLRTEIAAAFDLDVPTLVRDADEWRAVVEHDPFRQFDPHPSRLVVVFCAEPPLERVEALLEGIDLKDDRWVARGRELYVSCPNGQIESPVLQRLGRPKSSDTSSGPATVRTWGTVLRVAAKL